VTGRVGLILRVAPVIGLALLLALGCRLMAEPTKAQILRDPRASDVLKMRALRELRDDGPMKLPEQTAVILTLGDPNPILRIEAARTLKECGHEGIVGDLKAARNAERELLVRDEIDMAIAALEPPAAQPAEPESDSPPDAVPAAPEDSGAAAAEAASPETTPAPLAFETATTATAAMTVAPPPSMSDLQFLPRGRTGNAPGIEPPFARQSDPLYDEYLKLEDPAPEKRIGAAVLFRILGNESHLPLLRAALARETDPGARKALERAIAKLEPPPLEAPPAPAEIGLEVSPAPAEWEMGAPAAHVSLLSVEFSPQQIPAGKKGEMKAEYVVMGVPAP
jgi:hypothetical protein